MQDNYLILQIYLIILMFLIIYSFECYIIFLYQNKFIKLYILELYNLPLYPYFS